MKPEDRDEGLADVVLELIAHIRRRLSVLDLPEFQVDRDEIDLTAYRLATIGETTRKFSLGFKAKHPEIDWVEIYDLHNVVAHDYLGIEPELIWRPACLELDHLETACRTIAPQ